MIGSSSGGTRRLRICMALGVMSFLAVPLSVSTAAPADADTKQECRFAYVQTQVLRDADKLQEAIKMAQVCGRDVCEEYIRADCTKWAPEIEARVASIVVEAIDASGAPVTDATVSLDGVLWLDRLDGAAHVVSKGPHTLEVAVKGGAPHKKAIVIREGEKNRKITVEIVAADAGAGASTVNSIGPWIVGGIGVGALIGGAVTGGFVVNAYSVMKDECDDATETCRSQEGVDAQNQGRILGPVTTSLLVGGGTLVAAGIVWLVVARTEAAPSTTSFFVAPAISGQETGFVLGGSW